jgi:hypothetical protein
MCCCCLTQKKKPKQPPQSHRGRWCTWLHFTDLQKWQHRLMRNIVRTLIGVRNNVNMETGGTIQFTVCFWFSWTMYEARSNFSYCVKEDFRRPGRHPWMSDSDLVWIFGRNACVAESSTARQTKENTKMWTCMHAQAWHEPTTLAVEHLKTQHALGHMTTTFSLWVWLKYYYCKIQCRNLPSHSSYPTYLPLAYTRNILETYVKW